MKRLIVMLPMALVVLLIGISTVNAQRANDPAAPQSGYELSWYAIAGGGATFNTGGSYSLGGTIGQPAAMGQVGNSPYTLDSGFWGGVSINYDIFLPLVKR